MGKEEDDTKWVIHIDGQPIEISVKVSNEVTAKGDLKPSAELRVTRKLINSEEVVTTVHELLELGVKETNAAIEKALLGIVVKEKEEK